MPNAKPNGKNNRSRTKIKEATIRLIQELPPSESITVMMIAKAAGVNRATFYYHYDNLNLVFYDMLDDILRSSVSVLEQNKADNSPESFSAFFIGWIRNSLPFCQNFIQHYPLFAYSNARVYFADAIFKMIAKHFGKDVEAPLHLSLFLSGLTAQMIDDVAKAKGEEDLAAINKKVVYSLELIWARMRELA